MTDWRRVATHLEARVGKHRISYRVNLRQADLRLRKKISDKRLYQIFKGPTKTPEALSAKERKLLEEQVQRIILDLKYGEPKQAPTSLVRCDELIEQLLKESAGQDAATQEIKKNILGKHLGPWLDQHCPYAADLTVETWPKYKIHKRALKPTIALENHVKYFRMLARRAFELGILKQKLRVPFNVKKEEFRKAGLLIPKEDEIKLLAQANRVWRNRSIIQRDTGMRPGEVRCLKKDRATFNPDGTVTIRLLAENTKTHRAREFLVESPRAVRALREQGEVYPDSPYFFAMETDHQRPMDKHMGGWKGALERAGVRLDYTPHDWRHTYATEMFQRVGIQGSVALCYQLDMSLETANEVYLHLNASDTRGIASAAARGAMRKVRVK